jgi:RHS repeat-associated protein
MIQDEAGRQLQYNAWNRLVRVSLSGDQVAAYQYNGFQQRIVTTVGNGPSAIERDLFYSAGWQVLEQRIRTGGSLGNVAEEQFVWSVAYIDGLILRDRNADLNNATGAGGLEQRVYALHDALWNTTALVDVNGNVLNRFAYTPYGVVETFDSNWTPTASPSIPWAILFRGYFADEGTGLLHARARQYSPTLGRFVGRDSREFVALSRSLPIEGGDYIDGWNLYRAYFVPTSLDPTGRCKMRKRCLTMRFEYDGTVAGESLVLAREAWGAENDAELAARDAPCPEPWCTPYDPEFPCLGEAARVQGTMKSKGKWFLVIEACAECGCYCDHYLFLLYPNLC